MLDFGDIEIFTSVHSVTRMYSSRRCTVCTLLYRGGLPDRDHPPPDRDPPRQRPPPRTETPPPLDKYSPG